MNHPSTHHRRLFWLLAWMLAIACLIVPTLVAAQASVTGAWARLSNLPIVPIHVVLLPNGKVMLWGKNFAQTLWDPVTQATSHLPNPGYDLFCAGHSYLGDGRVLVAGGHIADFVGLPDASIYDPATNSWTRVPDMNAGRWYPTVTTLPNGDVLVVSGQIDTTVGVNPLPQVFQRATNTWRNLDSAELSQGLYPMMIVAPNGQVLDAAPTHFTRFLNTGGAGSWGTPLLRTTTWRDYGSAVQYADGKILVVGGKEPPTNSAEVIDLNAPSPTWRAVSSMAFARRYHTATALPDGQVLITGGTTGSVPAFAAEMWDPATERFTTMASQSVPRLYHGAGLLLPDGRVVTTGGDGYSDVEVFSPPYLFKGARPSISGMPGAIGWGQTFTVDTPDAASIRKVTLIRLGAPTHGFDQNQRLSTLAFSIGSSGFLNVTAPPNANLAPPGPYMLFIVNGNGVPSVAGMVTVGSSGLAPPPPPPAPAPSLGSVSPTSATAGGPAFSLTVNGANFLAGSVVRWNGSVRSTTFVSTSQLRAAILAEDIATAGGAQVSVLNPGGQSSGATGFTVSAASGGGGGGGGTCSAAAWVQGAPYAAGAIVSYNGALYVAKFANPGYNPTISTYYWAPYDCGSGTTAPPPPPPPAPIGSCSYAAWVQGRGYAAGDIVSYNGALYVAKFANPGYNPTISTYYWAPYSCGSGTTTPPAPPPPPTGSCSFAAWVQGRSYAAGAIVTYNASLYIAKFANPGYNPTISTYYWAPYSCTG